MGQSNIGHVMGQSNIGHVMGQSNEFLNEEFLQFKPVMLFVQLLKIQILSIKADTYNILN